MGCREFPEFNMMLVSKSAKIHRKEILKLVPAIGLTCINYRTMSEVDLFYQDCQLFRDYYRDSLHRVHRPAKFCQNYSKCGVREDHTLNALSQPVHWVREYQPVVYPAEYSRRMNLDGVLHIGAHFSSNSANNFKR